jgi:hypothetical protein
VSVEALEANDKLDSPTISEILKLQTIFREIDQKKTVSTKQIKSQLETVMKAIAKSAESKKIEDDILMKSDEGARQMYQAEKFNEILLNLPETGPTSPAQNRQIEKSLRNIVTNLAGDPNLNLADQTASALHQKSLPQSTTTQILHYNPAYSTLSHPDPSTPEPTKTQI